MGWVERFHVKYDRKGDDDCWLWNAACQSAGYGAISVNGVTTLAHRAAYQLAKGPIPEGMCVLHRCDVPGCVNPAHLFIGTKGDNTYDMIDKGRDRFRSAHPTKDKLRPESVPMVKFLADSGQFTLRQISEQFGIPISLVFRIKTGDAYIVRVA